MTEQTEVEWYTPQSTSVLVNEYINGQVRSDVFWCNQLNIAFQKGKQVGAGGGEQRWTCIGCECTFARDDYDEISEVLFCSSCATAQARLGRIKELVSALQRIADERNEFEGQSLDYMQGYRDGQEHLAKIAREAL